MPKRPISITIISWFLIIAGLMTFVSVTMNMSNPEVLALMEKSMLPVNLQIAFSCIGGLVTFICGLLILKGKVAGRKIYIGWTILSLIISLIVSPDKMMIIPGLVFSVIIALFLFRANASAFFNGAKL